MEPAALTQYIVRRKFKPMRNRIRKFRFVDIKGMYKQLFADPLKMKQLLEGETPEEWADICRLTLEMLDEGKLHYEDATPFLLLKEFIEGFQTNSSIKHIVVDEAQDYTPFQFEFLKRLFPAAKMTVLGDFNQAIFAHASEMVDFHMLTSLYGPDETEVINYDTELPFDKANYRIYPGLIPGGEQIVPFDRDGEKPVLTQLSAHTEFHQSITAKVAELQSLGNNSIAIICKSSKESFEAYEALSSIDNIKLLKSRFN